MPDPTPTDPSQIPNEPASIPTDPSLIPSNPSSVPATERLRAGKPLRLAVALGVGLALVVGAALALGASPAPSGAGPAASQPTKDGSDGPWLGSGGLGFGFEGGHRSPGSHFGGLGFGGITVTAISGSNLSLKTVDGWTRTIAVGSPTTFTKGGQTIALADINVGDTIRLRETRNSDGTFTIVSVEVVLPSIGGSVTEVGASGFTLKSRDGTSWSITVTSTTTYARGVKSAARSDVTVGDAVFVQGTKGSGNALTATSVRIQPALAAGTVTAKTATTITIKQRDGSSLTIHVGSGTTYRFMGVTSPTLANVSVGMRILAEGSRNADGSLQADAVGGGGHWLEVPSGGPGLPEAAPEG